MTHVHLLIDTNSNYNYNRQGLAKELGINKKAITYLEKVKNASDVANYVTKDFWKRTSSYDIKFN